MSDIVKVLFELQAQGTQIQEELNKISSGYKNVSTEAAKQNQVLKDLMTLEEKLVIERTKSQNPTNVVLYNAKLKEVRTNIKAVSEDLVKQNSTLKDTAKQTNLIGENMKKAFNTNPVDAFEKKTISIRAQLRTLREQIAKTDDDEEFIKLSIEAGKLEDKIGDATTAARIFASDSKFEVVSSAISNVGQKILALDFDGAVQGSQLLLKSISQISFKDVINGAKQLGSVLTNIGEALLKNPLFLLAGAIAATIAITKDLIDTDERYGEVLKENQKELQGVIDKTIELTRANRDLALQNEISAEKIGKINGEQLKNQNTFKDAYIDIGRQQLEATKKFNDEIAKAQEEDGFRATKSILNSLGYETDITKKQKKGLLDIQTTYDQQREALRIQFGLSNQKILIDEANAELEIIKKLNSDIRSLRDKNQLALFDEKTISGVQAQASKLREIARAEIAIEKADNLKDVVDKGQRRLIEQKEAEKLSQQIIAINRNESNAIKALKKEAVEKNKALNDDVIKGEAELNKALLELQISNSEFQTNGQVDSFSARIKLTNDYYTALISLTDKNSSERTLLEAKLNNELIKIDNDHKKEIFKQNSDALTEQERHVQKLLQIELKGRKNANVVLLANELLFAQQRLQLLKDSGIATEQELIAQQNRIDELTKEHDEEVEKSDKEKLKEDIDNIKLVVDAVFNATNDIIASEQRRVDQQISLQQKRVAEAEKIAENGNANLLAQEKKRLEQLNKEHERFARQEQAVAIIQLVANTAVTVSKAAAEGGAAAPFTIAAALLALIGGLAAARSIASQAAFYEGGYTGDGNPRGESTKLGRRSYIYHNEEFVHNHQTTRKFRDVFEGVHQGKIDLNEWKDKVELYDMLRSNRINTSREINMKPMVQDSNDSYKLKASMDNVIDAIKSQPGMQVHIDEKGIFIITNKYYKNKQRINNIAR